jgi:hypothetical protein
LSLLTPIAKAFLTETGYESANHGVQIFGGHGFISEHGMEQIVRDTRIACLYEGTTEIQALDLLGRKVLQTQGAMLKDFTKIIHKFVEANKDNAAMQEFVAPLLLQTKSGAISRCKSVCAQCKTLMKLVQLRLITCTSLVM